MSRRFSSNRHSDRPTVNARADGGEPDLEPVDAVAAHEGDGREDDRDAETDPSRATLASGSPHA